jgi:hypothetical protein
MVYLQALDILAEDSRPMQLVEQTADAVVGLERLVMDVVVSARVNELVAAVFREC